MQESEFRTRLETAARIGAFAATFFYICGFLVVTFSNASHGIVSFGLFRAKMLTAGFLFSIFVALPLLDWSRVWGRFGFPRIESPPAKEETVAHEPRRARFYFHVKSLFQFFLASFVMAAFLCLYLLHCDLIRFWGAYLGFFVGCAAVQAFCALESKKRPLVCAVLCLFTAGVGVAGLLFLPEKRMGLLIAWFILIGWSAHFIEKQFQEAKHWGYVGWHWVLVYVIGAVAFFGLWLYPRVEPSLGGGKPTKAVFQFLSVSPIDGSKKDDLWLLDESDTGYYVLRTPDEEKAVFIPRSLVSAIYFGVEESVTQKQSQPAMK